VLLPVWGQKTVLQLSEGLEACGKRPSLRAARSQVLVRPTGRLALPGCPQVPCLPACGVAGV
jgi:hypothetical protein